MPTLRRVKVEAVQGGVGDCADARGPISKAGYIIFAVKEENGVKKVANMRSDVETEACEDGGNDGAREPTQNAQAGFQQQKKKNRVQRDATSEAAEAARQAEERRAAEGRRLNLLQDGIATREAERRHVEKKGLETNRSILAEARIEREAREKRVLETKRLRLAQGEIINREAKRQRLDKDRVDANRRLLEKIRVEREAAALGAVEAEAEAAAVGADESSDVSLLDNCWDDGQSESVCHSWTSARKNGPARGEGGATSARRRRRGNGAAPRWPLRGAAAAPAVESPS